MTSLGSQMNWWFWESGDGASEVNILTDVGKKPAGRRKFRMSFSSTQDYFETTKGVLYGGRQPYILAKDAKPIEINASELRTLEKFGIHIDIDQRSSK